MELPPGHKHSLLITPTFIGLVNFVTIFYEPYTVCEWFLVAPVWTSGQLHLTNENVCFRMRSHWSCSRTTPSATVCWSAVLQKQQLWSIAFRGISLALMDPRRQAATPGRPTSSGWRWGGWARTSAATVWRTVRRSSTWCPLPATN